MKIPLTPTPRELWRQYYRAVRTLANIREVDRFAFHRFSRNWWDDRLSSEYDVRKNALVYDQMRRRLHNLRPRRLP